MSISTTVYKWVHTGNIDPKFGKGIQDADTIGVVDLGALNYNGTFNNYCYMKEGFPVAGITSGNNTISVTKVTGSSEKAAITARWSALTPT